MKRFTPSIQAFAFIFLLIFSITTLFSQNIEFTKENFPGQKKELRKALKNIKKGDELFSVEQKGSYAQALDFYLMANNFNPDNAWLNFKIGVCYLKSFYRNISLPYLQTAYRLDSNLTKQLNLFLGDAYQYNGNYDLALKHYEKYKNNLGQTELALDYLQVTQKMRECEMGRAFTNNPNIIQVRNLSEKVNSMWDDFSPVLTEDENIMAFTSRRSGTTGNKINPYNYLFYEDIYFTYLDDEGAWVYPENPGKPLNSKANDATVSISADGNTLSIFRNLKGQPVLCESTKNNDKWTKPVKYGKEINYKGYSQTSATFTKDRKTMFFVSNRKGGHGGTDIYCSKLLETGEWGEATNVGEIINSPFDEESPCLLNDSTLYFSSEGHNSIGEYDIFVSRFTQDSGWSTPVNLGVPMNSPGNDLFLNILKNGDGIFCSDRQGGLGGMDLYYVKLNLNIDDLLAEVQPVYIYGYVLDELTMEGVKSVITITDITQDKLILQTVTDSLGQFLSSMPSMAEYSLLIQPKNCEVSGQRKVKTYGVVYSPGYEPSKDNVIPATIINGALRDNATGTPLQFPVEIIDIKENKIAARIIPDTNGKFKVSLISGTSYKININASDCEHKPVITADNNYQYVDNYTTNPVNNDGTPINNNVKYTTNPIDGMNVKMENIYFDFDKSYIRPDASEILNRHVELFKRYDWKIAITGHTDNMGSEKYNLFLSQKRAQTVANYLIAKGIKKKRLKVEGMGYYKPSTTNETEEGRQLNRRVEFRIIK